MSECGSRSVSSKGEAYLAQFSSLQNSIGHDFWLFLLPRRRHVQSGCSAPKLNVRDRGKEIEYGRRRSIGFIGPGKGGRQRSLTWKLDASKGERDLWASRAEREIARGGGGKQGQEHRRRG